MKITDKRQTFVSFEDIKEGTIFVGCTAKEEYIFMKTASTYCDDNGDYDNAVCLNDGTLAHFTDSVSVLPLNCELIIH